MSNTLSIIVPVVVVGDFPAGDDTKKCDFHYDWTDPSGTLHSCESPKVDTRPDCGAMNAAKYGFIQRNSPAEAWQLMLVYESMSVSVC